MILTVRMNILQILNVVQSDSLTKSVFTSVLPSGRLPDIVLERPKGYIVNVDGSDKPGSHWVAMFFPTTPDGKGDGAAEFMDPLEEKLNHYSEHFLKRFYKTIAVLIFIINMSYSRHGLMYAASTACFMHYIDVEIYPCQLLLICLRAIRKGTIRLVRGFIRKCFFVQ